MTDFGRQLKFGYFLEPVAERPLVATALHAERLGLDYVAIQDHPYQARYVDTWSLLGVLAGATSSIGLLPDVTNLQLRPPAMLAKAAASLDLLSGGRFELGLGAGAFPDAVAAYGGTARSGGDALAALDEAIRVVRMIWSGERNLRFEGTHYRLAGARSGPVPPHPIGIWLGTYGPKALRLTARAADGWLPSLRGERSTLEVMTRQLDEAAQEAGREPADLRRVLNVGGLDDGRPTGRLAGELADLAVGLGFDTFLFGGPPDDLQRLVGEVIPAVRAEVVRHRTDQTSTGAGN